MTQRHDAEAIERACEVAFSHGAWRLRTIRQLLKRDAPEQETFEFLEEHPIIRSLSDYGKLVATSFAASLGEGPEARSVPVPQTPTPFPLLCVPFHQPRRSDCHE